MTSDLFAPDSLIDGLVADLRPAPPRRVWREAAFLAGLVVAELIVFLVLRDLRPDIGDAMTSMAFWWKLLSLMALALLAAAATLVSLDPATTTLRETTGVWRALALAATVILAIGWAIDAGAPGDATLAARLGWREGGKCLAAILLLSLPLIMVFGVLMRKGASTHPRRTASAAGLAAAGLAAGVFALHCPHDDPLYIVVWYGSAAGLVGGLARTVLPRLLRW